MSTFSYLSGAVSAAYSRLTSDASSSTITSDASSSSSTIKSEQTGVRVKRLTVTPVKSTKLHHPSEIVLTEHGVEDNRRFMFIDSEGYFISGARIPRAILIESEFDPKKESLTLRFPNQTVVTVSTLSLGEHAIANIYGRDVPGRLVIDHKLQLALTQHFGEAVQLFRVDDGSSSSNTDQTVSIVSSESIQELSAMGEPAGDFRRYRMLIEVEGCANPYEEDEWLGRVIKIGNEVEIDCYRQCPRCELITKDPDSGVADFNTLRAIVKQRGKASRGAAMFGIYGSVKTPGTVRVGDRVEVKEFGAE